jgi:hypothetical protein
VRVNLAGQRGQCFDWGNEGLLPLCERILDECSSCDEERDDTEEDAMALGR